MGAMLNCKTATKLLLEADERTLTPNEVEWLEFHIQRCLCCQHFKGQMGFLRRVAERYARFAASD